MYCVTLTEESMSEKKINNGAARVRCSIILTIVLVVFTLLGSGCAYMDYWTNKMQLTAAVKENPSAALSRELTPDNAFNIYGHFKGYGERREPLLIVVVSRELDRREIVVSRILDVPAAGYAVALLKGTYDIFVLSDLDKNGFYDQREVVGRTPSNAPLVVSADRSSDGASINGPAIALSFDKPGDFGFPLHVKTRGPGYIKSSLEDEFFDPKYGPMGLYQPREFFNHTQGMFFGLEEFDPSKTIVIFVHGVNGVPRDWKYIVDKLDRKRFQPWFYYYPSGMPLEKLGVHLSTIIGALDSLSKGKMKRLVIVAHSMGGLVSRAAINDLCRNGAPPFFKLYVSLSTPYGGNDAAKAGVEHAPVVVPSWRDIAPDSEFLAKLYKQSFPATVPFHLFFGYHDDSAVKKESSDGTIVLRSQLDHRAQTEAVRIYGYDDTHVGILQDQAVIKRFNGILGTVALQK